MADNETSNEIPDEDTDISGEEDFQIFMNEIIQESSTHKTDDCIVDECLVCGYMVCPVKCLEHFFHDGCPACDIEQVSTPNLSE